MFDKTLFEAAASGCIVLAASADWKELAGERFSFETPDILAERLAMFLRESPAERESERAFLQGIAMQHSLARLADAFSRALGA